jgi:hypothetical protein
MADSWADGAVEKGIIHSNRNEYWLGPPLLLVREASLFQIENKIGRDKMNLSFVSR